MKEQIEACYDRISQHHTQPVWIWVQDRKLVLEQAEILRLRQAAGESLPLFGTLFAVKDNIDVADVPTTAGCREFSYVPQRSASVVEKALAAGALFIGKTNMDQFATGLVGTRSPYGACRNAFNADYISGGSSSGSALAVALGMVDFSLGTDTAGSGRVPAALNGLMGYKPTKGLLSTQGVVPACRSLDCVSIFASTIEETQRIADVLSGFDVEDSFSRVKPLGSIKTKRTLTFGVPSQLDFAGDHEAESLFSKAVAEMEKQGGVRVDFDYAPFAAAAQLLYQGPWVAERYAAVGSWIEQHPNVCDSTVEKIILGGKELKAVAVFAAFYQLQKLQCEADKVWDVVDVLFLPTVPTVYRLDEIEAEPIALNSKLGTYTNFVNLLDMCALAVPAGQWSFGVPFGVTLIAPAFEDSRLYEWALRFQGKLTCAEKEVEPEVLLAVVGAHLRGQPLHGQLTELGAEFVRESVTAETYRLYALNYLKPPKPGMVRAKELGQSIYLEIYRLSVESFGAFVKKVPEPLVIGTIELIDGSKVQGFLCESHVLELAEEITQHGSWIAYLKFMELNAKL